jgi:hypothetical protein
VKQFQPGYTLGWLRAWLQNPMRRCRVLRKSVFCRFMDDGIVVVGLHKLDKACQMLCGACEGGCRGDDNRARAQEGVGGVAGVF